jgi:putative effector of murein hydrolase LrgA (UPF0299 family)
MSNRAMRVLAVIALVFVAFPTGLCSLFFGPMSIAMMLSRDSVERSIGPLAAVMSAVGFLIAGLTVWFAMRVKRRVDRDAGATMNSRE